MVCVPSLDIVGLGASMARASEVSVPVGISGRTHWFDYWEINGLHCLSQAAGKRIFGL